MTHEDMEMRVARMERIVALLRRLYNCTMGVDVDAVLAELREAAKDL